MDKASSSVLQRLKLSPIYKLQGTGLRLAIIKLLQFVFYQTDTLSLMTCLIPASFTFILLWFCHLDSQLTKGIRWRELKSPTSRSLLMPSWSLWRKRDHKLHRHFGNKEVGLSMLSWEKWYIFLIFQANKTQIITPFCNTLYIINPCFTCLPIAWLINIYALFSVCSGDHSQTVRRLYISVRLKGVKRFTTWRTLGGATVITM